MNRTHTPPHPELSEQIREFTDRLVGAPHLDKTGSWIRGKMTRPSLDSLGNWLGGRLTEFVAGSGDSPTMDGDTTPHESKTFAGPFSHYSTITPSTTSKVPSPQPTSDHITFADAQNKLPQRTGSAQALRHNPQVQIDRASSAMEYRPAYRSSSPAPRIVSASAATSQFTQINVNYGGYPYANDTNGPYQQSSGGDSGAGAWWGSSSTGNSSTTTPTVPLLPNDRSSSSSDFVSLMEVSPIPSVSDSSITPRSSALVTHDEDDDDDDLGLGNSSNKRKVSLNDPGTRDSSVPDSKPAETDTRSRPGNAFMQSLIVCSTNLDTKDPKPNQQSSSWFSRWWNKDGSSGPVKATLGEESSFVYDKELKRWVNKKVRLGLPVPGFSRLKRHLRVLPIRRNPRHLLCLLPELKPHRPATLLRGNQTVFLWYLHPRALPRPLISLHLLQSAWSPVPDQPYHQETSSRMACLRA